MKKLIFIFIVFFSLSTVAQQKLNQLKFDDGKYFYNKAKKTGTNFKYTVDIKLNAVEIIGTDNNKVDKFNGQGKKSAKKFGKDKELNILAIPALYQIQDNGSTAVFMFGQNGAEGGLNSAEVTITRNSTKAAGTETGGPQNKQVKVDIKANEFYTFPNGGSLGNKTYLYLNPEDGEKMEISIQREAQRGLVYVGVFDKNGKLLKALDPKFDPNALSFVVDSPVYVIPVIAPTAVSATNISFEVGDPRQIATVDIEEE